MKKKESKKKALHSRWSNVEVFFSLSKSVVPSQSLFIFSLFPPPPPPPPRVHGIPGRLSPASSLTDLTAAPNHPGIAGVLGMPERVEKNTSLSSLSFGMRSHLA